MVDEFQDTDQMQVDMIKRIAGPGACRLCTVGDAQQSIYRFRGADVSVYRRHLATVRGADPDGVIVLPDGVTSATGFTSGMNGSWIRVSDGDWEAMEADGALFLPAAGMRDVMNIRDYDYYGYYWSSTRYNRYDAYGLLFDDGNLNAADYATNNAAMGKLVRLVRNAE